MTWGRTRGLADKEKEQRLTCRVTMGRGPGIFVAVYGARNEALWAGSPLPRRACHSSSNGYEMCKMAMVMMMMMPGYVVLWRWQWGTRSVGHLPRLCQLRTLEEFARMS